MAISVKDLSYLIYKKLKEINPSILESLQLTEALDTIEKSIVKVSSISELPPAEINKGIMFFVEDIEDYRVSNGTEWDRNFSSDYVKSLKFYTLGPEQLASQNIRKDEYTPNPILGNWDTLSVGFSSFNTTNSAFGIKNGELFYIGDRIEKVSTPFKDWCHVHTTRWHNSAIRKNGSLWGWGRHAYFNCRKGAIGDGTIIDRSSPVLVAGGFTDWCKSYGEIYTSFAFRKNGTLWAWGSNESGQLGDGTTVSRSSPVSIRNEFFDWSSISTGLNHTTLITGTGNLWSWGCNDFTKTGLIPVNTIFSSPTSVIRFEDITWSKVSSGYFHNLGVIKNGPYYKLVSWGRNNAGQLGINSTFSTGLLREPIIDSNNWISMSAGRYSSSAISQEGILWTWGCNSCGRLGDGTTVNRSSPVTVVGGFTDWHRVSAGNYHSAATRLDGTLWTWGENNSGQLGAGTIINRSSPGSVLGGFTDWCKFNSGGFHTAAIRNNGTLWTWGGNNCGQLGDGTKINRSSPVSVIGGFTDWCQVNLSVSGSSVIGIRSNNSIWGIGDIRFDNIRNSISSPVSLPIQGNDWKLLVFSGANGGLLFGLKNNAIFGGGCFCNNGSLFPPFTEPNRSLPRKFNFLNSVCDLSMSIDGSLAVQCNGTLWAWGRNFSGNVGDGTTRYRGSPVSVIGGFTDWCQVSISSGYSAGVRTNGTIWSWGNSLIKGLYRNSSPVNISGPFTDWCCVNVSSYPMLLTRNTTKGF